MGHFQLHVKQHIVIEVDVELVLSQRCGPNARVRDPLLNYPYTHP